MASSFSPFKFTCWLCHSITQHLTPKFWTTFEAFLSSAYSTFLNTLWSFVPFSLSMCFLHWLKSYFPHLWFSFIQICLHKIQKDSFDTFPKVYDQESLILVKSLNRRLQVLGWSWQFGIYDLIQREMLWFHFLQGWYL